MPTATKQKSKTQELFEEVKAGVSRIQGSDEWKAWLDANSKFWKYSFHNQMLIWLQKPNASRVAGYKTWLDLGRHVKKGEHGIFIFAPRLVKVPIKKMDEKEELVPVVKGFVPVAVFDISQTEGKELPTIYHPLKGATPVGLLERLLQFSESKGFRVKFDETPEGVYGFVTAEKEIVLKSGEEPAQSANTFCHEIAHAFLGHIGSGLSRDEKELEAETTAWILCRNLGLETSSSSFAYLAHWSAGPERDKKLEAAAINACATAQLILKGLEVVNKKEEIA
jgi:antirestriction protein ArdC